MGKASRLGLLASPHRGWVKADAVDREGESEGPVLDGGGVAPLRLAERADTADFSRPARSRTLHLQARVGCSVVSLLCSCSGGGSTAAAKADAAFPDASVLTGDAVSVPQDAPVAGAAPRDARFVGQGPLDSRAAPDAQDAPEAGCSYNGHWYPVGEVTVGEFSSCTCFCQQEDGFQDGFLSCPALCGAPPEENPCYFGGSLHPFGTVFPAGDGCNTCQCEYGAASCTADICLDGGSAEAGAGADT